MSTPYYKTRGQFLRASIEAHKRDRDHIESAAGREQAQRLLDRALVNFEHYETERDMERAKGAA